MFFLNIGYTDKYGVWNSISVNPPVYPDVHSSDIPTVREFITSFERKGLYFEFNAFNAQSGERYHIAVVKVPTCLHTKAIKEVNNEYCRLSDNINIYDFCGSKTVIK